MHGVSPCRWDGKNVAVTLEDMQFLERSDIVLKDAASCVTKRKNTCMYTSPLGLTAAQHIFERRTRQMKNCFLKYSRWTISKRHQHATTQPKNRHWHVYKPFGPYRRTADLERTTRQMKNCFLTYTRWTISKRHQHATTLGPPDLSQRAFSHGFV